MPKTTFRPYRPEDRPACLRIFDANCPHFFAADERDDYASFLDAEHGDYETCEANGRVIGAFGLSDDERGTLTLNWIMLDPDSHGSGLGSTIMRRVNERLNRSGARELHIAASHKSAPFFEKFGARPVATTENGWAPGMHRVDMRLVP